MANETCQICGTALPPGYLRYCDECVSHFSEEERQRRARFGKASSFEERRRRPAMTYASLMLLVIALPAIVYLFVSAAMFGPGRTLMENSLAFLVALSLLVSIVAWGWLWTATLSDGAMWAVGSLIFPVLVYRYAQLRWERRNVRALFITHALSLITAAALTGVLAHQRRIGYFQALAELKTILALG